MLGLTTFIRKIDQAYHKKIDGTGLAIFRIAFCFVQLCEVINLFYFRHLVYDDIPYLEAGEVDFSFGLILWGITLVFLMLGLFTRTSAIINYVLALVCIGTTSTYEYHMFYAYMGVNFLMIFLPLSKCYSIDRLLLKLKYSTARVQYNPDKLVSSLAYFLPVLFSIAFFYFDSTLWKFSSGNWMSGIGAWLPSSSLPITQIDSSVVMNNKFIAYFMGYATLVFELVFIFLFWFKKFRLPLLVVGVILHLGILIEFPIPWFALGVIALYILMVPVGVWSSKAKPGKPSLTFFYDNECPLCIRAKIIIEHFDSRKRIAFLPIQLNRDDPRISGISEEKLYANIYSFDNNDVLYEGIETYIKVFKRVPAFYIFGLLLSVPGIHYLGNKVYQFVANNRVVDRCTDENCGYYPAQMPYDNDGVKIFKNVSLGQVKVSCIAGGVLMFFCMQLCVSYNTPHIQSLRDSVSFDQSLIGGGVRNFTHGVKYVSKRLFGITHHAVFMDGHFDDYNHVIGVTYQEPISNNEIWLPITNEQGMPGKYLLGFNWVRWTFRANGPNVDQDKLAKGIMEFTAFWAHKNDVSLDDATFNVKVKKIRIPEQWEKDYYKKSINAPWIEAGRVQWKDQKFDANLKTIENI